MPGDQGQWEWVKRVLGVGPRRLRASGGADRVDRLAIWRDAKEAVDAKLIQLAQKLRDYGDPDFDRIADFGLFGMTDGQTVALNVALRELAGAAPAKRPTAAAGVRTAISDYRAVMAGDGTFDLIDENQFGVDVALRATLGAALNQIERSLG